MDEQRATLEHRWLELTRRRLPNAAVARGWRLRADHCFQRVLLDHACGGVWYDAIVGRPAYRTASDVFLHTAIEAGEALLAGTLDLATLDDRSLAWRGKRPR